MNFRPPIRADLDGIEPYGAPVIDVPARLNVNENPFPISDQLSAAMGVAVANIAPQLNRYPDREAWSLRCSLASYVSGDAGDEIAPTQVWAANGSNEVMHQIFAAFGGPGRSALTFPPTYSMYPEYARETFTQLLIEPRRPDFSIDIERAIARISADAPTIVVVASPNNPTGTAITIDDIRRLTNAAAEQGAVVVIDEAYAEFRREGQRSALTLLPECGNLAVSRTMSKAFSMAGARVGYVVADVSIIDVLRVVRLPYHLSAVTQVVAQTALEFSDELLRNVDTLRNERDLLAAWLRDQGLHVADSDANFIFFGQFTDSDRIWNALVDLGVLIRQTGPDGWLRVSIGTPEENAMFRAALSTVLEEGQR